MIKSAFACLFFCLLMNLMFINLVCGYARITVLTVYALSWAIVGEEVSVQAHIHTGNNRVEYVHDVKVLLVLPIYTNMTSGNNPLFIGEMGPGPADVFCNWTVVFTQAGTYTLMVNASCIDTQYVFRWMANSTTVEAYDYPHADFEFTPSNEVYVNQTITFNATESRAQGPSTEIVSYQWNFGDGTKITLNSNITKHTYKAAGNFEISLKITDSRELSTITTANITVNLFADLNLDGTVNIQDISIVAHSFGTTPPDALWNSKADLNHDEAIDIIDLSTVAKEFGKRA